MSTNPPPITDATPAHAQLVQMSTAYWVSRLVHLAAELGIADHLAAGPLTADELAVPTKTHAPALYRVLRSLASLGVFTEDAARRFSLTELGKALKTGAPGSARATILTLAGEPVAAAWQQMIYSVRTGKPAFDQVHGKPLFSWLAEHPADAALFGETMIGFHGAEPAAVASAYDFSAFSAIVDVGGGTGNLLTTILAKFPQPRGVVFDMPHVAPEATALIKTRGLGDRATVESGDFFQTVPKGGDVYIMSHVIHDWNEEQCRTILTNCRRAMNAGSRLLLIEMVLPPGDAPHPGKLLDMMMLVGPGGQERTTDEYRTLLKNAGFRLERVIPTNSAVSIVEAFIA
jgi:hypothetical protein